MDEQEKTNRAIKRTTTRLMCGKAEYSIGKIGDYETTSVPHSALLESAGVM
jgi:hypothetical protein